MKIMFRYQCLGCAEVFESRKAHRCLNKIKWKRIQRRSKKIIEALLDETYRYELANIDPADSGLSHRIWIQVDTKHRHSRPQLRIEGSDGNYYPFSLDDPIEVLGPWPPGFSAVDFKDLRRFIVLNRGVLMGYWQNEVNTKITLNRIRNI